MMKRTTRLLAALALAFESFAVWTHGHAGEPSADTPKFEVSAVVIQEDGRSWALMAEPKWTQGATRLVARGAMVGPYQLVEVASDHVVMQGPTGPPFRVPFSWRGAGAASGSVRAPQEPEKGSRSRAERKAAQKDRKAADEGDDEAQRSARRERRRTRAQEGATTTEASSPASSPDLRELSRGLPPEAQAQIEEFLRLRDQALKEELAGQDGGTVTVTPSRTRR